MFVFIDESGDPGFKLDQGSTQIFVAAMVMLDSADAARRTTAAMRSAQEALRVKPEFKFSKCHADVRDEFFRRMRGQDFSVRAIVVRKGIIRSQRLQTQKDEFYRYFVRSMLSHDGGALNGARVVIDGSGDRKFRDALKSYLRRQIGDRIESVRFQNSRNDLLVQLADMCVGAIARSYRTDRPSPDRWRKMLKPRISDIWEFE